MKKQSISFEKVKNFSTDQIVGQVVRTSNYGMFRKLDGNRGLNGRHLKIKKSIEANGYIMSPIIINENHQIIDGQGRVEALKMLGMPIDYVVAPGLGIEACIAMNAYSSAWKVQDYVDTYVSFGNENYVRLDKLSKSHVGIGLQGITSIALGLYGGKCNTHGKNSIKTVQEGHFEMSEKMFYEADLKCNYIDRFYTVLRGVGGHFKYWALAISFCYSLDIIQNERLYNQVIKMASQMHPCTNVKSALQELEVVYNYKNKAKVYIYTEYDRMLCESRQGYQKRWGRKQQT